MDRGVFNEHWAARPRNRKYSSPDIADSPQSFTSAMMNCSRTGSLEAGLVGLAFVSLVAMACSATNSAPAAGPDLQPVDGGSLPEAATGADAAVAALPLPTGRFRIGVWCGPPPTDMNKMRIDELVAGGFTDVSNPCDGSTYTATYNQSMLALAAVAGLDVMVSDSRIAAALAGADVEANLDAVVKDYASAKALAGYFVGDEPGAGSFANVGTIMKGLVKRDPKRFAYSNLLPGIAGPAAYDTYVGQFIAATTPKIMSFDHYPFLSGGTDSTTFFSDLSIVRAHAVAAGVPYFQFIQAISYNGHRATTREEKLWEGTETLAYGGAGVSYFTYWSPPNTGENFGEPVIANGTETQQYAQAKDINPRLQAYGRYLVAAKSTAVFHNGALAIGTVPRVPGTPAYLPSAASITVGLFSVNADAYVFLANRDYKQTTESDVFLAGTATPEVLDVGTGAFGPMTTTGTDPIKGAKVHVSIPAGDGILIHLTGPIPAGPPGAEAFVATVRKDQATLDIVDSSWGESFQRMAGWDECPAGYPLAGHAFDSNGMFLCVRGDLATRTFYVGNVVADGSVLYQVKSGAVTSLGPATWNTCPKGTLLGRRFESNGYWLCME
jgi:hypothetical protein